MAWHAHTGPYQAVHKAKICLLIDIPCLSWPCSSGPVLPNILHPPVTRRARRSLPLVTCEDRGVACCQPYGLDSDSWLYPKISQNYIYIHIANSMGKMVIIHWNILGPTQFPFAIPCAHQATNRSPIESFCLILGYTMVQPILMITCNIMVPKWLVTGMVYGIVSAVFTTTGFPRIQQASANWADRPWPIVLARSASRLGSARPTVHSKTSFSKMGLIENRRSPWNPAIYMMLYYVILCYINILVFISSFL
jgi:hypothetical protein